ncbi:unnamed protein product [Chrysodeixis includens]|uniref:Uncharacterized protein n=1 Tax=Chrysodeixis includens TaxID=689277 RepID=A0A9P0BRW0_CHRIL|nr:unnamed protein product [Chrysodeixis includens]
MCCNVSRILRRRCRSVRRFCIVAIIRLQNQTIMRHFHIPLFILIATTALCSCYCPPDKVRNHTRCAYRILCYGNIRGLSLPDQCREATNYPVTVDVTLTDAQEDFDDENLIDEGLLNYITTLKISAQWPTTKLAILTYTTRLQNLYLVNNCIEKISGNPFYYLSRLENLYLAHNKLTDIEFLFQFQSYPNRLRKLSLAFNEIEDIPGDAFDELSSLVELDLSYNKISDLTEEPFYNLTKLEILRLNNNQIKDLNGAVNGLPILKQLFLRGNQIHNIDEESLKIIKHLETFDLSKNDLEQVKPVMFSRHWEHFANASICRIILSENQIVSVPNATSNEISSRFVRQSHMHNVDVSTDLNLSVNSITDIQYNAFQSLIKLVNLNLSKNKLINFVVNPNDLIYVKYLNLSGNFIMQLYSETFSSMNNLQNLDLSGNQLDFIPDMAFNNNYNLKYVNMTYNDIEKLDAIHINMFHPNGGAMDLSNNHLYKLTIPYGEGLRLYSLILHSNNISDISLIDLSHQSELQSLDFSRNSIEELHASSLLLPASLESLDLTRNRIQRIGPSTFVKFSRLRTLRLSVNYLTEIEYGMFQGLSSLKNLDLSYNRIKVLESKFFLDLKCLQHLSVRSNGIDVIDFKSWYGHKFNMQVIVDNNNFTCEWLSGALSDFNNGYSRVKPAVLVGVTGRHSLEGIPCEAGETEMLVEGPEYVVTDERLLVTSQKILEAVREQNFYLRKFMWKLFPEEVNRIVTQQ